MNEEFRIGLALGGGGAAALSSIGVLEQLDAAGIRVHCVAGTSAGAIVGAAHAAGHLDELREVLCSLTRSRFLGLFDPCWTRGGLMNGRRGMDLIAPLIGDSIEELPLRFAAVAADLDTGEEVVLDRGPVFDAVRASLAIPGVFLPHTIGGRVLVDGGLVNPIPVSVARRLGADFVVAISVLRVPGIVESSLALHDGNIDDAAAAGASDGEAEETCVLAEAAGTPCSTAQFNTLDVLSKSSAVVQAHIAAARFRDDPPDLLLHPPTAHIGVFALRRAAEAVEAGRETAARALPGLLEAIEEARKRRRENPLRRFLRGAAAKAAPLARPRTI